MEENKNISCDLCGKNKENRIWYLDKCICDECAEKISETVGIKKKNSPEIVDYIDKDPCDEFDEFFKEQHDSGEFGCHVLMAIASGIIGYYFTKKIYGILVTENMLFSFRIILLILLSLLPILAVYLLFCYRKNKQNSMDNKNEKISFSSVSVINNIWGSITSGKTTSACISKLLMYLCSRIGIKSELINSDINGNIGNISYVLCAIVGGILALSDFSGLTIGTLVAFLSLNKSFTQPVTQISQQVSSIVMAMAGAGRVFELCDEKPEVDEGFVELVNVRYNKNNELIETKENTEMWAWKKPAKDGSSAEYTRLAGDVTFDGVDFGYNPDKMVLHDIKMYATPGQKIAFVGSTGAGKTTITNLINRFYDIQDGKIRYDGININNIKKNDLRRSLGIVLQDTNLFTGTIMDNIRYGRLEASDEECIAAARLANADGFIKRLPDGYNTVLHGGGANLSQGQRQLLAIARAAVADPPVLILDEATSSIDTRTERLVQKGMDALMSGRTSFVIAHRLSTVRNADCIMVMEQGRIIERGTHDQLMEEKGRYYQLYTGKSISA